MKYILGLFFLLAAAIHGRHLWRWIQEGESDVLMTASGDGIFGRRTKRNNEPFQFWIHIALNGLIITALAAFGLWTLLEATDF